MSLEQHIRCRDYLFILNWVGLNWGRGKVFTAIPISSAAIVLVSFGFFFHYQVANSETFFHQSIHFIWNFTFVHSCTSNSLTTAKLLLYLYFICNFLFLSLMSLTRDLSIFPILSKKYLALWIIVTFSRPLLLISTLSYYFNPSDFIRSGNVVRMMSIFRTWRLCL